MNRFKKIIASFVAVISILAFNVTGAGAEWKASGTKWWYSQGSSYATGWTQIDGQWYYFDSNGYMVTGWMQYGNSWYYFYDNGMMAHDCYIGSYYLNSNGEWTTHTSSYTGGSSYSSVSGSSQNKNKTAYLSATGKKYHSIPNCGRMDSSKATTTTVEKAEAGGYGRCSKCW